MQLLLRGGCSDSTLNINLWLVGVPLQTSASLVLERSGKHQAGSGCATNALDIGKAPSCLAPERSGGAKQLTRLSFDGGPSYLLGWHYPLELAVCSLCYSPRVVTVVCGPLAEQHLTATCRAFEDGVDRARCEGSRGGDPKNAHCILTELAWYAVSSEGLEANGHAAKVVSGRTATTTRAVDG
jgi:hypothetical protein